MQSVINILSYMLDSDLEMEDDDKMNRKRCNKSIQTNLEMSKPQGHEFRKIGFAKRTQLHVKRHTEGIKRIAPMVKTDHQGSTESWVDAILVGAKCNVHRLLFSISQDGERDFLADLGGIEQVRDQIFVGFQ